MKEHVTRLWKVENITLLEQFYKNKSLNFEKKIKNKLRTKPGLLSNRT